MPTLLVYNVYSSRISAKARIREHIPLKALLIHISCRCEALSLYIELKFNVIDSSKHSHDMTLPCIR
jgi:hypothetical protein